MNRRSIYQASATLLPLVLAVKSIVAQCPYYRLTPWMVGTYIVLPIRGLRLPGVHRNVETWPVTVDTSSWGFTFVPTYTTEVFTDWC